MSLNLESTINTENTLIFILTPISCDKTDIYKQITKMSSIIKNNHRLVTVDKNEDNMDQISYEEFGKYQIDYNNVFFFIDNIEFFGYFNIEWHNKSNVLIFLIDITDIEKIPYIYNRDKYKVVNLYPINFCNNIEIIYRNIKSYIVGNQLKQYKEGYLKYIKEKGFDPSNYLNVYYNKNIKSLKDIFNVERMLELAPKFKSLFLNILTKNKKRHTIHLEDSKYGIEAFKIIYDKINTNIPLIILKTSDGYSEKSQKLSKFNSNNSPGILLSDYWFMGKSVPKNIDIYHIFDGGKKQDFISIFEYVKIINKFSSSDRNLEVINHIASTVKGELTLDEIREIEFKENLEKHLRSFDIVKKKAGKLYLEGTELKIEV